MITRAIIIAAGMGSRLREHTQDRPKCMVQVGPKPLLRHQVDALRSGGVERVSVVRGYLAHAIPYSDLIYYENPDYQTNNILHSLFYASPEMEGPVISSYADILYHPSVIRGLIQATAPIVLAVDLDWASAYTNREDHPVQEAELVEVQGSRVTRVGKSVGQEQALGEFMGLARYNQEGARWMREVFAELQAQYAGHEDHQPFGSSPSFRRAYLSDMLEELIRRGHPVHALPFRGGWREIDTVDDLLRVRQEVESGILQAEPSIPE